MKGKDKCQLLKAIRRQIAEQYGLEYHPTECHHEGECAGTCPRCDAELKDLQHQLEAKGIHDIDLSEPLREQVNHFARPSSQDEEKIQILQGDVIAPGEPFRLQGMPAPPEDWSHASIPAMRSEKKKVVYKECQIAGWNFHDPEDFWDELYEGAELVLVREKNNKHDRNAVAVVLADDFDGDTENFDFDFIIGYVPRTENEFIAQMMDLGWSDAFTAELTTVKDNVSYADRLRMTIYIQSKEADEPVEHKERMYAQIMDDESFTNFREALYKKGYVFYRWPVLLPDKRDFLEEGDKVVFIHKHNDSASLYLMHLVAKGDDHVMPFVNNPEEELEMTDDCIPFVLTNVKGPITCSNKDLAFLDGEDICERYNERILTEYAYRCLNVFFEKR